MTATAPITTPEQSLAIIALFVLLACGVVLYLAWRHDLNDHSAQRLTELCPDCLGTCYSTCPQCNQDLDWVVCDNCHSTGRVPCPTCRGFGKVVKHGR